MDRSMQRGQPRRSAASRRCRRQGSRRRPAGRGTFPSKAKPAVREPGAVRWNVRWNVRWHARWNVRWNVRCGNLCRSLGSVVEAVRRRIAHSVPQSPHRVWQPSTRGAQQPSIDRERKVRGHRLSCELAAVAAVARCKVRWSIQRNIRWNVRWSPATKMIRARRQPHRRLRTATKECTDECMPRGAEFQECEHHSAIRERIRVAIIQHEPAPNIYLSSNIPSNVPSTPSDTCLVCIRPSRIEQVQRGRPNLATTI